MPTLKTNLAAVSNRFYRFSLSVIRVWGDFNISVKLTASLHMQECTSSMFITKQEVRSNKTIWSLISFTGVITLSGPQTGGLLGSSAGSVPVSRCRKCRFNPDSASEPEAGSLCWIPAPHPHHSYTSLLLSFHHSSRELIFVSTKTRRHSSRLLRRVPACTGEGHFMKGDDGIRAWDAFCYTLKVWSNMYSPIWDSRLN